MPDPLLRPMTSADVAAAERISSSAFYELDQRTHQRGWPDPSPRSEERAESWRRRTEHLLRTDPEGCWVAQVDGQVVGFATSLVRELMWILASYGVQPDLQGHGLGRALLEAALRHGRGCLRGMLNASPSQQALRHYARAGFELHPQLQLTGRVDRSLLRPVRHVREGVEADRELMDSVDRHSRGAAHGADHGLLMQELRLLVTDRPVGSGYAYVDRAGAPRLLAATSRKAAAALTWEALASSAPDVPVRIAHVSPANQWAVELAVAARLDIWSGGFLALRTMKEPAPYLPHGSLL